MSKGVRERTGGAAEVQPSSAPRAEGLARDPLLSQGEGSTILSADVRMVVAAYLLLPLAFGVVYGQVPGWAGR